MKLVYVAQGIGLAIERPFFEEKIQAWPYGPVVQSVYSAFKQNGSHYITETAKKMIKTEHLEAPNEYKLIAIVPSVSESDSDAQEILRMTWESFGTWSGVQLSNWSHEENSPWDKEWHQNDGKSKRSHPMSDRIIADYFKKIIE